MASVGRGVSRTHPYRAGISITGVAILAMLLLLVGPSSVAPRDSLARGHSAPDQPTKMDAPQSAGTSSTSGGPTALPQAAFSLTTDGLAPSAISLNWTVTTVFLFSNYTVEYSSVGASGPFSISAVVVTQATTGAAVSGLTPGGTYWWVVVANGAFGNQTTNVVSAVQPTLSFLNYTNPTASSARLTWTNNASYGGQVGFVSYTLFVATNGGPPSPIQVLTTVVPRTYTLTGLSGGTSYSFFVNTTDCAGGCGTGAAAESETQSNTVTFGTALPLVASIGATRPVVDVGQPDFFTCTPSGGKSPFTFSWNFGNGTYVAGSSSMSFAFSSPGAPSVTCRITDSLSSASTAATTLSVNSDPTVALTINRTAADIGQLVGYDCSASQGTTPYSLFFAFGDGGQSTGAPASHAYSTPSRFVASCSVSDSTGTQAAASATFLVSPLPTATATVSYPRAAPGTVLTYTAHPSNGSGNFTSLNWTFSDGASATGMTANHSYGTQGNHTATLRVTDTNRAVATGSVYVRIRALSVSVGSLPSSLTVGHSTVFNATASGGAGGTYNFTWKFGDGAVGYGPNALHTFARAGSFLPQLTVMDSLGANNSTTLASISVTPPPGPFAWVTGPLIVVFGLLIAVIVAVASYLLSRRASARFFQDHAGRVPLSDPQRIFRGAKVCRYCGTSNLPVRDTCETCGKPLRLLS